MPISGKTRVFAVLGHPVAHTLSPPMHNANFASLGEDAVYVAFDVAPDRLLPAVRGLGAAGVGGLSVTIPHKETLFAGLTRLDASARAAGAVNTVRFVDGEPEGHNTDGEGWLRACEEDSGERVAGRTLCVLGSGGSARAVATTAARAGAALVLVARRREKAEELAEQCRTVHAAAQVRVGADADIASADLVVNCTPLGMKPGETSPWTAAHFRTGQFFMDLVYVRPMTLLMEIAAQAGARTANGLGMLLHQGGRQYEIWTGRQPDLAAMRAALEKAVYGR